MSAASALLSVAVRDSAAIAAAFGEAAAASQTPAPPAGVFEIVEGPDGQRTASNGVSALHLLDADGRVFRRRAVKGLGGAQARMVEWAVVELHGVRVYFDGLHVVVTTRDIYP